MNPYLSIVLEHLIEIILGVFVVPLLVLLLKFAASKLNLHLDSSQEDKLSGILTEAVSYAEEWARSKMKANTAEKPSGAQKLEAAIDYALDEVKRRNLDTWAKDQLIKKITAALGLARTAEEVVAPAEPPK